MRIMGGDAPEVSRLMAGPPQDIAAEEIPAKLYTEFQRGGFIVDNAHDELAAIRDRYWSARGLTPMVLTLTTTQDCNLGCYYCYEARSNDALASSDVEAIVEWTKVRLVSRKRTSLHVDWYGGEPLLNQDFLELASQALQNLCRELEVSYSASIISNGTRWPEDVIEFIRRHKIRQVQISFDGLKTNHDKRRRYRKNYSPSNTSSSFELASTLVLKLLDIVRVDVRFNVDQGNADDLDGFIALCIEQNWFNRNFPCVFQLARISDYSERSGFMSKSQIGEDEFEKLRERSRALLSDETQLDETTSRSTYPLPRMSVCAALATDSVVIGADGNHYRCGLQVGEKGRAVLIQGKSKQATEGKDAAWWAEFDPTLQPNCQRCSFLPVCWGGCPKKHLERDTKTLDEQSLYWRKALPQKIAWQFGIALTSDEFAFSEKDQFRG